MNGLAISDYNFRSLIPSYASLDKPKIVGAVITASAIATTILTYQYPLQLTLATLVVTCLNVYTLPKLMASSHSPAWVSTAFATICTVWGSLLWGIGSVYSYAIFREIISYSNASPLELEKIVTLSIIFTSLSGYLQWFAFQVLKRAYATCVDFAWKNQMQQMQETWQKLKPLNWLSFDRFKLIFCLLFPNQAPQWMLENRVNLSPDLLGHISTLISIPELFNATLKTMREYQLYYGETACPKAYKKSLYALLKSTLESMECAEKESAFFALKESVKYLVPSMMSPHQFLDLFVKDGRYNFRSELLQLLKNIKPFTPNFLGENPYEINYRKLLNEALFLKEPHSVLNTNDFERKINSLKRELSQLREEIASLCKFKQEWKNLYTAFDLSSEDQALFQNENQSSINEFYQKLLSGQSGSLVNVIECLSHQLEQRQIARNANQPDLTETYIFLSSHCDFKSPENLINNDYEDLRQWLHLESMADIQDTLEKEPFCLKTAEDLYVKKILPRPKPNQIPLTKSEVKANLKKYIEDCLAVSSNLRTQIYKSLSQIDSSSSPVTSLIPISQRISNLVFRFAMAGLIFIPIYLHPVASSVGFGLGLLFFTVKRITEHRYRLLNQIFFTNHQRENIQFITPILTNRRLLLLTPIARRNMNTFSQADFFAKMRMLNYELLVTLGIEIVTDSNLYVPERLETERGMGAFMQGLVLADEALDIIMSGWNIARSRFN